MFDRRQLLCFAAATAAAPSTMALAARARARPHGSRSAEVRALRLFAEHTHPRGREARDDATWQARWTKLQRNADRLSDGAYFVEARRALAWFEDGHTTVLPFEFIGKIPPAFAAGAFGLHLPWKVRVFDDGAYVTAIHPEHRPALGLRVKRVGMLDTRTLIGRFSDSWPGNRAWTQNWAGSLFAAPGQLQGLEALSNPAAIVPVIVSGPAEETAFGFLPGRAEPSGLVELDRRKTVRETWAEDMKRGNYVKLLPDRRALYLSIDDMDDVEGMTFEQLTRDTFAAMDSGAADRLIIDLRRNGGGNNFFGEPLRKHIERSAFNQPGRLFVLIGPATFSAAQNFANRLERETFAIFVGSPTGLSPNHYGDAKIFTGAATGLTAMVSTLAWFDSYPQDKREWIMPDLLVPATFADWRAGRDPALESALSNKIVGLADDLSRDRIFYYARASQKKDWKPFWA